MAVKIRLSRIGKKKAPFYRIVAVDSRKKRDGAFLEDLGTYDALNSKLVRLEIERVDHWIAQGAIPTDSVERIITLFKKVGISTASDQDKKIEKKVAPKKVANSSKSEGAENEAKEAPKAKSEK